MLLCVHFPLVGYGSGRRCHGFVERVTAPVSEIVGVTIGLQMVLLLHHKLVNTQRLLIKVLLVRIVVRLLMNRLVLVRIVVGTTPGANNLIIATIHEAPVDSFLL